MDWNDYRDWLFNNKSHLNAKYTFKDSEKYFHFAFSDELVSMKPSRKRQDILKGISNITRYLDIKNDTDFHELWLKWLKKKEIRWRMNPKTDTYFLANQIRIEDVLKNIRNLPEKYRIFATFVLVSGLRTSESIEAFNNHDKICREGVMELFWDRRTKKANAVYCHPYLHTQINHTISRKFYHYITKEKIGFELRDLRKLNYTINATKLDPLLAEFMQGRRGNVSQRHYFLPMMNQHRKKWIKVWKNILQEFRS